VSYNGIKNFFEHNSNVVLYSVGENKLAKKFIPHENIQHSHVPEIFVPNLFELFLKEICEKIML
ncbi:MAG: hypothetical protein ACFFD1_15735, partial [Candidatus Thorarchaeota archaeon]